MLTIGLELISSETVALNELIKNSYDADATTVLVRLSGPVIDGAIAAGTGMLEVLDDGCGMDAGTVAGTWLEPATPNRRGRRSSVKGRRLLGEKGVGRFAAAKLSHDLELRSRMADQDEVELALSWDSFEDEDAYLDDVEIEWSSGPAEAFRAHGQVDQLWKSVYAHETSQSTRPAPQPGHGTLLRMPRSRSDWTLAEVEEIKRALSRLISPFGSDEGLASAFTIVLDLPLEFAQAAGVIDAPDELQRPHYRLDVDVAPDGTATGQMHLKDDLVLPVSRRLLADDPDRQPSCGPFTLRLRVWDRDETSLREVAGDSSTGSVRSVLDSAAGISVYRDGFRVLPYGERGDDWLQLDARRVQAPTKRLSNNQIVGYVIIGRDTNPGLLDQTNREGLVQGTAADDLRAAIRQLLTQLENERYKQRPRRKRRDRGGLLDRIDLGELKSAISARVPDDKALVSMVVELQGEIDQRNTDVGQTLSQYHRLATLGQLVDRVIHELGQPLAASRQSAALGSERAQRALGAPVIEDCRELVTALTGRLSLITTQLGVASDVVRRIQPFGGRRRGRPATITLERAIDDAVGLLDADIQRVGARVSTPKGATQVTLDGTELQEVLVNLLTNSLYWLRQVPKGEREIRISSVRNVDGSLSVAVEDSGPGVDPADHAHIFDAYFTTREGGVGLGLSIAGEIVSDFYGGELSLVEAEELGGARLVATLRKRVG